MPVNYMMLSHEAKEALKEIVVSERGRPVKTPMSPELEVLAKKYFLQWAYIPDCSPHPTVSVEYPGKWMNEELPEGYMCVTSMVFVDSVIPTQKACFCLGPCTCDVEKPSEL